MYGWSGTAVTAVYSGCGYGYGTRVGIPGWVTRVGIPGTTQLPGERSQYSEAGPGRPTGPGVGGTGSSGARTDAAGTALHPPYGARSVPPCGPSLVQDLANAASWPNRARFHLISYKVSQNG